MDSITREDAKEMVGAGWASLIDRCYDALKPETYVLQVKEKFGGLRFYIGTGTTEEFKAIDAAEHDSYHICERCGEPGKLREDLGWILTLCERHYQETLEERVKWKNNAKISRVIRRNE